MFRYSNKNPLNRIADDCTIRSISCATHRSWDEVYDELSDLAQHNGTMMDNREFIQWYLDNHYERVPYLPETVGDVAREYKNNVVLCTMNGHITCIKYGVIYDTFNPSRRYAEEAWIVK